MSVQRGNQTGTERGIGLSSTRIQPPRARKSDSLKTTDCRLNADDAEYSECHLWKLLKNLLLFLVFCLLFLFPSNNGLGDFCFRNPDDALGLIPAVFVRKLCDAFSSFHNISGSGQPAATLQTLVKTHCSDLQICNPTPVRRIFGAGTNYSVESRSHRLRENRRF